MQSREYGRNLVGVLRIETGLNLLPLLANPVIHTKMGYESEEWCIAERGRFDNKSEFNWEFHRSRRGQTGEDRGQYTVV